MNTKFKSKGVVRPKILTPSLKNLFAPNSQPRERVSIVRGTKPIILVVPHGADDTNTSLIADECCVHLGCSAVINRGFERSDDVDVDEDQANCNRIDHTIEPVVFDEFLDPLVKMVDKMSIKYHKGIYGGTSERHEMPIIFFIHGCGNIVHRTAGEDVAIILGYGQGKKNSSYSCDLWRKDLFGMLYEDYAMTGSTFDARGGGKYAGRSKNNMNQYFVPYQNTESIQLEFPYSTRHNTTEAVLTGLGLASTILEFMKRDAYTGKPVSKII